MSNTRKLTSRGDIIRVRVETDLKPKLVKVARKHRKNLSEFLRDKMWELADQKTFGK